MAKVKSHFKDVFGAGLAMQAGYSAVHARCAALLPDGSGFGQPRSCLQRDPVWAASPRLAFSPAAWT